MPVECSSPRNEPFTGLSKLDLMLPLNSIITYSDRATGMTPLMYAAQMGDAGLVKALLQKGSATSLTTHQGHTAARIAQDAGFHEVAAVITQWGLQGNLL